MDVPLKMIHGNQWLVERKGECLGGTDANEQRTGKSRSLGDGEARQIILREALAIVAQDVGDASQRLFLAGLLGQPQQDGRDKIGGTRGPEGLFLPFSYLFSDFAWGQ